MKTPHRILIALLFAALLPSCATNTGRNPFAAPSITLSYDDFGPERIASQLLGPRGTHTIIIAHHGFNHLTPSSANDVRYINILQSMNFLTKQVRLLPPTPANEPLRQRLRTTYSWLYPLNRQRYDRMLGSSFVIPAGGMSRRLMLPALLPPSI